MKNTNNDLHMTLAHLSALARLMHEARALAVAAGISIPPALAVNALQTVTWALRQAGGGA